MGLDQRDGSQLEQQRAHSPARAPAFRRRPAPSRPSPMLPASLRSHSPAYELPRSSRGKRGYGSPRRWELARRRCAVPPCGLPCCALLAQTGARFGIAQTGPLAAQRGHQAPLPRQSGCCRVQGTAERRGEHLGPDGLWGGCDRAAFDALALDDLRAARATCVHRSRVMAGRAYRIHAAVEHQVAHPGPAAVAIALRAVKTARHAARSNLPDDLRHPGTWN